MKTKTCHRTLAALYMSPQGPVYAPAACLGSECSAWRWTSLEEESQGVPTTDDEHKPQDSAPGPEWRYSHSVPVIFGPTVYVYKRAWAPGMRPGTCGLMWEP